VALFSFCWQSFKTACCSIREHVNLAEKHSKPPAGEQTEHESCEIRFGRDTAKRIASDRDIVVTLVGCVMLGNSVPGLPERMTPPSRVESLRPTRGRTHLSFPSVPRPIH
jgi:hypothetical protein